MKITKSAVDRMRYAKSGKAADYRWDDLLMGFGVRIYPSGRRAFVITYRNATGTKRFVTLGNYGVLTVKQARSLAQDASSAVQFSGIHYRLDVGSQVRQTMGVLEQQFGLLVDQ